VPAAGPFGGACAIFVSATYARTPTIGQQPVGNQRPHMYAARPEVPRRVARSPAHGAWRSECLGANIRNIRRCESLWGARAVGPAGDDVMSASRRPVPWLRRLCRQEDEIHAGVGGPNMAEVWPRARQPSSVNSVGMRTAAAALNFPGASLRRPNFGGLVGAWPAYGSEPCIEFVRCERCNFRRAFPFPVDQDGVQPATATLWNAFQPSASFHHLSTAGRSRTEKARPL